MFISNHMYEQEIKSVLMCASTLACQKNYPVYSLRIEIMNMSLLCYLCIALA